MNDEQLEKRLRELPAPELPTEWRGELLAKARREARGAEPKHILWPAILVYLRNLYVRNPVTATAMTAVWVLIFFLRVSTPIDPQEKLMLAHFDPKKPVYFVSIHHQMLLAQLALDQSEQKPQWRMP